MLNSNAPECPRHKKPMTPSTHHTDGNESSVIDKTIPDQCTINWICPDCSTSSLTDYLQMIEEYADKTGKTIEELTEDPFID